METDIDAARDAGTEAMRIRTDERVRAALDDWDEHDRRTRIAWCEDPRDARPSPFFHVWAG